MRQGFGAFLRILRRLARRFSALPLLEAGLCPVLSEPGGMRKASDGGDDFAPPVDMSSSLLVPAVDCDLENKLPTDDFAPPVDMSSSLPSPVVGCDLEKKLPTFLPKRRILLPSNFTLPMLIPPSPPFVAALPLATDLLGGGGGSDANLCIASRWQYVHLSWLTGNGVGPLENSTSKLSRRMDSTDSRATLSSMECSREDGSVGLTIVAGSISSAWSRGGDEGDEDDGSSGPPLTYIGG